MFNNKFALIGLGAIGTPIAHKLYNVYHDNFYLIASGVIRSELENADIVINGEDYSPTIISTIGEIQSEIDVLIVCVKNYDLNSALIDIQNIISDKTIILPLQNGIYSYNFFCEHFPKNQIIQGYVQGPNTQKHENLVTYSNPGVMHIGNSGRTSPNCIEQVYNSFKLAGIDVLIEDNIKKMVWKKWMLNVAGNYVTALTGADYSKFKKIDELKQVCRESMNEFLKVAMAERIDLDNNDIEDIINYYVTYKGTKKTSMLEDVLNKRKTENDYLAGNLIALADKYNIEVPITKTLFFLIKIKEKIYFN